MSGGNGGINFTQFLSMMGEHLLELDPEVDVLEAFACFDEADKGVVQVSQMRRWLGELGDRMDDREVRSPGNPLRGGPGLKRHRSTGCSVDPSRIAKDGSITSSLQKCSG